MKNRAGGTFNGLFLGGFEHSLDSQGRIILPSEWRQPDGETTLIMIPTREQALLLLPVEVFQEFVAKARQFAIANASMQAAFAYLGYSSRECRCDKQGRMALDRKLLEKIGVKDTVSLVGAVTHIRLSAPENWNPPDAENAVDLLNEIQRLSDENAKA